MPQSYRSLHNQEVVFKTWLEFIVNSWWGWGCPSSIQVCIFGTWVPISYSIYVLYIQFNWSWIQTVCIFINNWIAPWTSYSRIYHQKPEETSWMTHCSMWMLACGGGFNSQSGKLTFRELKVEIWVWFLWPTVFSLTRQVLFVSFCHIVY